MGQLHLLLNKKTQKWGGGETSEVLPPEQVVEYLESQVQSEEDYEKMM